MVTRRFRTFQNKDHSHAMHNSNTPVSYKEWVPVLEKQKNRKIIGFPYELMGAVNVH
mgnify:CR=1 FL=1